MRLDLCLKPACGDVVVKVKVVILSLRVSIAAVIITIVDLSTLWVVFDPYLSSCVSCGAL